LKIFYSEHLHDDDEIRFVLDGSGYFDIRDPDDNWIRLWTRKGDMIVIHNNKMKFFDEFRAQEIPIILMCTFNGEGVIMVRNEACERLLAHRVEQKLKTSKFNDVLNRLHIAESAKRDEFEQKPFILESSGGNTYGA
jgi:gentisate 1,2-dioxygenase